MRTALLAVLMFVALGSVGCSTAPASAEDRAALKSDANRALARFKQLNPGLYKVYDDTSVGVAVFPTVGEGAFGVGYAQGRGVLLEDGKVTGYALIQKGSIGFQIGGQAYSEIIFFKDNPSLRDLKRETLEFAAEASAVIVNADASASADYDNGVRVFIIDAKGAMVEASVGGQQFSFTPADAYE